MAQISYDNFITDNATNISSNSSNVGFFSIVDGEEAIVRIMLDSPDDFDILTCHPIYIDGKFRQVSCVRDPKDPVHKCPLCASGEKIQHSIFIKLIHYNVGPDGKVVGTPEVWQRNASVFAPKLKSYLDSYGPLSNIVCKITRHGSGLDTKYDIIPNINPSVYTLEAYPKVENAFSDYKTLGRLVLDKSYDDIAQFMETGHFPELSSSTTGGTTPQVIPQSNSTPPSYTPTANDSPMGSISQQSPPPSQMNRPVRQW